MTDLGPLPETISVTQSFIARLPAQRVVDQLRRIEPDLKFGELIEEQSSRVIAFRWLLREYPDRDPTSLWMHAYDVETAVIEVDPTNGKSSTALPPSALTTS
jgi:hypothetical protein